MKNKTFPYCFPLRFLWENRKIGDTLNDCLLSVDGTDFQIAMSYRKEFYSFKFKKSGLRYEVGLNIKTGDICWVYGPFPPGDYNDPKFSTWLFGEILSLGKRLKQMVDTGEQPRGL